MIFSFFVEFSRYTTRLEIVQLEFTNYVGPNHKLCTIEKNIFDVNVILLRVHLERMLISMLQHNWFYEQELDLIYHKGGESHPLASLVGTVMREKAILERILQTQRYESYKGLSKS